MQLTRLDTYFNALWHLYDGVVQRSEPEIILQAAKVMRALDEPLSASELAREKAAFIQLRKKV